MRVNTRRRRQSQAWRGVDSSACLAMAPYIAFDFLDLDGSTLRDPLRRSAIAAESIPPETSRVFSQRRSTLDATICSTQPLAFRSARKVSPPPFSFCISGCTARLAQLRPRAYASNETFSVITASDHPA